MSHLTIETLARMVDESPDAAETAHLEICDECRTELEGLRADAVALAGLPELQPPPEQWFAVEKRLAAEGLLRNELRLDARRWWPAVQMAAAIAVFVLGHVTAPMFSGAERPEQTFAAAPVQGAPSNNPTVSTALNNTSSIAPNTPLTREEAAALVQEAGRAYVTALSRFAEMAASTESADPVARLAALESIVLTTRAALGQAPADPVINGYHLTALAQRDATLKQLASAAGNTWF